MAITSIDNKPLSVWVWRNYDQLSSVCFDRYQQYLSGSEKLYIQQISSTKRKREYIAGHYLLRAMLHQFYPGRFTADAIVHLPRQAPCFQDTSINLQFNISHSRGLIICALSKLGDVGIDIEAPKSKRNIDAIAASYYSDNEAALIGRLDVEEKKNHFYRLWTLKESLIKAKKKGIAESGMKIEFTQANEPFSPSGWYSYGFVYHSHYGAITVQYKLAKELTVSEFNSDLLLSNTLSLSLSGFVPQDQTLQE